MTKEEAITTLGNFKRYISGGGVTDLKANEAIDMAIEALKSLPSAEAVPQSEQYKKGFEDAKRAFLVEYARESENMRKRNAQLEVMLNAQKAILADRPKGKWIETAQDYYEAVNKKGGGVNENTEYFTDDIACSECLTKFSNIDNETERFNFCPNCGADMRGDEGK